MSRNKYKNTNKYFRKKKKKLYKHETRTAGQIGAVRSGTTYQRMSFCPVVVDVDVVIVVDVDVSVVGSAAHIMNDCRHGRGASGVAERLQQGREGRLSGGQGRRQGAAERQKFLTRHVLIDRHGRIVLCTTTHVQPR